MFGSVFVLVKSEKLNKIGRKGSVVGLKTTKRFCSLLSFLFFFCFKLALVNQVIIVCLCSKNKAECSVIKIITIYKI